MSNTIKTTNRTIEISDIDEDYMMEQLLNVDSAIFLPGAANDKVEIFEDSTYTTDLLKVKFVSGDNEPRGFSFAGQRLRLGFIFANGTFSGGSKVIFNIGESK